MQPKRRRIYIFSGLALVVTVLSLTAAMALHAQAQGPKAVTSTYKGSAIQHTVLATATNFGHFAKSTKTSTKGPVYFPYRRPGKAGTVTAGRGLPSTTSAPLATEGTLGSNFDGISDAQNLAVAGFEDTPPDQGLCVGFLNGFGGKVIVEVVNSTFAIYNTHGVLLSTFPMSAGFGDPFAFSDPRCYYDTTTNSFYMSVISCKTCNTDTFADVLVVNRTGQATTYQFDTSVGGTCFGDQPHLGYDSRTVFVSTDEFCGANYDGALVIGISKEDLVEQFHSAGEPESVSFGPVSLGGVPILTLEPSFGNDTANEFLLNSFPFDQYGNSNSISDLLGYWTVSGEQNISDAGGTVTLTGQLIQSEAYAFPVPAKSTGNGATPTGSPPFVINEPFLNPDDDRMLQVQAVNDEAHGLQLYAALDSAISIHGDPSNRDGVAWFIINPATQRVYSQGYVALSGRYLLYPAIAHTSEGTTVISFTITGPHTNPAAGTVVRLSTSTSFGPIVTVAAGARAHLSFSDVLFGRGRWGDYSATAIDPDGVDLWGATEYIGPISNPIDNWGTRIWAVNGDV